MTKKITIPELREGDILLYHGTKLLSRIIRFFDGTEYNHAALCMNNQSLREAIARGVVERGIPESVGPYKYVDVYRLRDRPGDMDPVLRASDPYLGERYAFEQLVLLALLCSVRRIRINRRILRLINRILEAAAAMLLEYTNGGKKALVCSELVYRSYDEALPDDDDIYTIYLDREMKVRLALAPSGIAETGSLVDMLYGSSAAVHRYSQEFLSKKFSPEPSAFRAFTAESDDAELERLFADAEASVAEEDYSYGEADILETKMALDQMMTSLYMNVKGDSRMSLEKISLPTIWEILRGLKHVHADFVTPGDLLKSSLLKVGNLSY